MYIEKTWKTVVIVCFKQSDHQYNHVMGYTSDGERIMTVDAGGFEPTEGDSGRSTLSAQCTEAICAACSAIVLMTFH